MLNKNYLNKICNLCN